MMILSAGGARHQPRSTAMSLYGHTGIRYASPKNDLRPLHDSSRFRGRLATPEAFKTFAFAGHASFTVQSLRTDTRFTYRITEGVKPGLFFVSVLTGASNTVDFSYLGFFRDGQYRHGGAKAKVGADAPSAQAFAFLLRAAEGDAFPTQLAVYHEGKCGACNRKLTVPASVLTGLGPECSARAGIKQVKPERVSRVVCDEPVRQVA